MTLLNVQNPSLKFSVICSPCIRFIRSLHRNMLLTGKLADQIK
jgi:hypothetical protein